MSAAAIWRRGVQETLRLNGGRCRRLAWRAVGTTRKRTLVGPPMCPPGALSGALGEVNDVAATARVSIATELAGFSPQIDTAALSAVSTPIFQTATFDVTEQGELDYTRSGNPTRHALEELCSKVEHAQSATAFTSGMAALTAVLRLLIPGDEILASKDIYGGMHRLLRHHAKHSGITVTFIETWDFPKVEEALLAKPAVRMICLESPTNPLMRVTDIRRVSALARANGALLCVDNSIMSPVLSTPLDLGADIVIHSATKFMSGHSDTMGGIVCTKDAEIGKRIQFTQNAEGAGLSPFDSWLLIRGMKTMALRVARAQANAIEIAELLRQHPLVTAVHYMSPNDALASNERAVDARLHFSQARGGGAVLSFETGDLKTSRAFVDRASAKRGGVFKQTVSFGSVVSVVTLPCEMSHASIPESERAEYLPPDLVRMSVGIEDPADLVRGVSDALAVAQVAAPHRYDIEAVADKPPSRKLPVVSENGAAGELPFGVSLPPAEPHAVGVSMPSWEDVIAYEEGDADTHDKLQSGYPRFVFLKPVQKLHVAAAKLFATRGEAAMAMPSARAAIRLQKFLVAGGYTNVGVHDLFAHGAFAVTFPAEAAGQAKLYWQHAGEIVSSRLASAILDVIDQTCWENATRAVDDCDTEDRARSSIGGAQSKNSDDMSVYSTNHFAMTSADPCSALQRRVATLANEDESNAFVYPTGMAAISAVHRLLKLSSDWNETPLRNVVFGFPYLDTLKLNGRPELGSGVIFFGHGNQDDVQSLEELLRGGERIGGLFCEMPSNPLLRAPPLRELRRLADEFNFPLVVDDSISGFCNVDVLVPGGADVLVSSLTKQFSGANNAMGGSLVLNSHSPFHHRLHTRLMRDYEAMLWKEDAATLLSASSDVETRAAMSNANAMSVVQQLMDHPTVKHVYHPSTETTELYNEFKRPRVGGYGALFSVLFHKDEYARVFYNSLSCAKGPGFGSNFTLVCPYTMIAHFNELEWCRNYSVDPSLVRVWTGLEPRRELTALFGAALDTVDSTEGCR
mmetsp:Transcript_28928/g.86837  ORF Transcript_28928/g.86837 Transcript_28928/m.86837 type:complete len:1028 (+) Transcript_28928:58-3141(+)